MKYACLVAPFFLLTATGLAYLNSPVEKLTLPELVKEFKSIDLMNAGRVDIDGGVVIWEPVEHLQGRSPATKVKHLVRLGGHVPEALRDLKSNRSAVFFSQDGWKRGVLLTDGCWYVVGYEGDTDCWRIAYTDRWYDFNICFCGSPEQLGAAVRKLLAGEEAIVKCRVKAKEPALQTVRYTMKHPKEKVVITDATQPAAVDGQVP